MSFSYLTNVPLEKAINDYTALLNENGFSSDVETVSAIGCCGRITAEAVRANICSPHYASSAMDGIAIDAKLSFKATETTPVTLDADMYVTVDTGDPLPDGTDAVVMVEDTVKNADGSVTIYSPAAPWQHVRQIGEDICAGEMILPSYMKISPVAVGAMIAGGVTEVKVIKRPLIGIIPTGDEIVSPCPNPKEGEILEFNSSIFSGMFAQWDCDSKVYPIVKDKYDEIKSALVKAVDECDIVIINAGSSAGRDDYSSSAIAEIGTVLYHGIAIKPGKPAILGARGEKPVLGVPGYPVSGIIVVEKILKPLIDVWYKSACKKEETVKAVLSRPVVSGLKYEEFVRVRLGNVNGKIIASPLSRGAGVVTSFMKAEGILTVPQSLEGYEAGEEVEVKLLTEKCRLYNTLVIVGSHDPLIDEVGDMMHADNPELYLASSHVGSMGGITAIKRGEAHAAGCHLLDTASGQYNLSYMRKYFPNHDVKLIRGVGRTQGLMTANGNPLNIKGIKDIAERNLRYVNRQKGSGTRILADFLLNSECISPDTVYGYEREEMTHTAVAAQIAGNSADAGLGIFSAAKLYSLDFVPVCTEEYDFIIPDYAFDTYAVREFLSILKSSKFREKLIEMGGYTVENSGEEIEY